MLHLALAQLKARKGDYRGNLARLAERFEQVDALDPRPAVLCLPETALSGYFLEGGVRDVAISADAIADQLNAAYLAKPKRHGLDVVIGFYERANGKLYNSAMYVRLGEPSPTVVHVHRKVFLPTYGLFDEERFVDRGHGVRAFDTPWGRAAMLVCEDAWHSISGTIAALDGAQVIFVIAASPGRGIEPRGDGVAGPASGSRWHRLITALADEHGVYVALTHLVGSEGGKVFPGGSVVVGPAGDLRVAGPLWQEGLVVASVDLADIGRARADLPLLADLETMAPHLRDSLARAATRDADRMDDHAAPLPRGNGRAAAIAHVKIAANEEALPVVRARDGRPSAAERLAIDAALVEDWLVHFIREEMARRGFTHAVIGMSGGVDSAVTGHLAARALGRDNVLGVSMPYRTSSKESVDHAGLIFDQLGICKATVDISDAVDGYLAQHPDADATRRGNVMARVRMITLFDLAARHRGVPLGTGNKTERLLGYFTWHADDSPPINPLGDLFKTQVWALARHLGVPSAIVDKPPTADLVAGQTDEGDFGLSYGVIDEILDYILRGYSDEELGVLGFAEDDVARVRRRLEGTHWKRRLPTVAMLTTTAIGESYLRPVDY